MLRCYCLIAGTFLILAQSVFGAVLTTSGDFYFPRVHHLTNPASINGVLSFIGEANGVTTYLFTDPGDGPSISVTLAEGSEVAILIATAGDFIVSYSCDRQAVGATEATCDVAVLATSDSHVISRITTTDLVDSPAFVEFLPASTPPPPSTPTSAPTPPTPTTAQTQAPGASDGIPTSSQSSSPAAAHPPPNIPTTPPSLPSDGAPTPTPISTSSTTGSTDFGNQGIQGLLPQDGSGQSNSATGRNAYDYYVPNNPIVMLIVSFISVFAGFVWS